MEITLILVLLTAYCVAWFQSPTDNEKDTHSKDSHSSSNWRRIDIWGLKRR